MYEKCLDAYLALIKARDSSDIKSWKDELQKIIKQLERFMDTIIPY